MSFFLVFSLAIYFSTCLFCVLAGGRDLTLFLGVFMSLFRVCVMFRKSMKHTLNYLSKEDCCGGKSSPCLINCTIIPQSDIAKNGHPSSNGSILRTLTYVRIYSVLDKPFDNNHAPKCAWLKDNTHAMHLFYCYVFQHLPIISKKQCRYQLKSKKTVLFLNVSNGTTF